jgi:SNF2 family DNA or RNA helicase
MKPSPLYDFQERAIQYCLDNKYSVMGLAMGLGKSRIAIEIQQRTKSRCLVVCPAVLVQNWVDEIRKWAKPGTLVSSFKSGKDLYDLVDSDFAVVSYDLAQKSEFFFSWANMAVFDEAHFLKSQEAKRTQFFHRVIYENSLERVHLLTGTPIKNRVNEWYSLIAICHYDPKLSGIDFLDRFPDSISFADYFSFRKEYTMTVGSRSFQVVKWDGLRRVDELKKYLKNNYIRIKIEDAISLPPLTFKDVLISEAPDNELRRAFDLYFSGDGSGDVNPTAKSQAALKTAPFTIQYVKNILEEKDCVVVYSDHVEACQEIAKAFGTTALTGKVPAGPRMELAKRFQNGEGRVLVASIGALSSGVTLTRSSDLILNDLPWVPGDLDQVVHRIRRISQTKPCIVHRIFGSPQSQYIVKVLEDKMDVIKKAT